jgi:FAD/FMN-containing dehydrogenase
MRELRVTRLTGEETILQIIEVADLRAQCRGPVLVPGDEGYDAARQLWNGMLDKRPALIARCTGAADVLACVNFARTHNVLVAVRGGDHSVAGNASCNGGLMLDLSLMKGVRVDPVKETASAAGGARWGDFDHETQAFGLATTGGTNTG